METILSIEEFEESYVLGPGEMPQSGFKIQSTKQTIRLAIDNVTNCCESWGYFWSNDNPQDFIGAEVKEVTLTDTALNTTTLEDMNEADVMFVNIETDRGTLQFVAYNSHNGYYGHRASVKCIQLDHSESL